MKANKKAINGNDGVTTVLGTMLMLPAVFIIVTFMMFWAQDLVSQIRNFQDRLNDMVDDINIVVTHLDEEYFIIWQDGFEGSQLQWERIDLVELSTQEYFNGVQSCKLTASVGNINTIDKEFAWQAQNNISIEFTFTLDPSDTAGARNEEYKLFQIYQHINGVGDRNIGSIKIELKSSPTDYEAEVFYLDESTSSYEQIPNMQNIPLYASDNCWHHLKLTVDFGSDGGDPEYKKLVLDGLEYDFNGESLQNAQSATASSIEYIKVEYSIKNRAGTAITSSFLDDFILRYHPKLLD